MNPGNLHTALCFFMVLTALSAIVLSNSAQNEEFKLDSGCNLPFTDIALAKDHFASRGYCSVVSRN